MDIDNLRKWQDFLNPNILKTNLTLTSLYIAFFESSKDYFVSEIKSFFSSGYSSETGEKQDTKKKFLFSIKNMLLMRV